MRAGVWAVVATLLALFGAAGEASAQAPACAKTDFEAVVNEAAGALRDLNRKNTPPFQATSTVVTPTGSDTASAPVPPTAAQNEIAPYSLAS